MTAPVLTCSFCGKSQHDVLKIVAGLSGCICDECSDLTADIMRRARAGEPLTTVALDAPPAFVIGGFPQIEIGEVAG